MTIVDMMLDSSDDMNIHDALTTSIFIHIVAVILQFMYQLWIKIIYRAIRPLFSCSAQPSSFAQEPRECRVCTGPRVRRWLFVETKPVSPCEGS